MSIEKINVEGFDPSGIPSHLERRNQNLDQALNRGWNQDGLVESYSIDRRYLMIHPQNLKKLTPTLRAP